MKKIIIIILVLISFKAKSQSLDSSGMLVQNASWKFTKQQLFHLPFFVRNLKPVTGDTVIGYNPFTKRIGYKVISSSAPTLDQVLTAGNSSLQNIEVGNVFTSGAKSSGGYYFASSSPGQYHQLNVTAPGVLTWEMPYSSGQLALASSLSSYLPLTGGTLTGNLLFTDNTYDIGASGATRPRTGYFGTSITTPDATFSNMTLGSVLFAGTGGLLSQDNSNLFWNNSTKVFGIGTATPGSTYSGTKLDIQGSNNGNVNIYLRNTSTGSSAFTGLVFGNNASAIAGGFFLTGSNNTEYGGANSVNLVNVVNAPLGLGTSNAVRLFIAGGGNIFAGGTTTPTARFHIAAGTATASTAPLKFTSGTNLTTAETGAVEYNGTNLFFTRTGTTRETVITANAVNSVSPTSPNRTITVVIDGVTYYIAAKTTND